MGPRGFESDKPRTATTGAEEIVVDGMRIDSPEAVVEHLERFVWPEIRKKIAQCDPEAPDAPRELIRKEYQVQEMFGPDMLKVPYEHFGKFPVFHYGTYGYTNYFMA
ncbi:MAG: hypothetical protein ACUVWX_14830 [Kiritimatiellia bacterium]